MKIKSIYMKNFGNISEFSANIGPGINYILASNGGGKSTVGITSVWSCLQGIAEKNGNGTEVLKGKRSMWVGRYGTDAEIEIVLTDPGGIDYTVNRKISENKLEIASSDGRKLDQSWINSFWSSMMLSPVAFSKLSPKEQAQHLGVDTSEYDTKIEELKDDAKGIRAVVKSFGEIVVPEKVEMVDIAELSADKDAIVKFNQKQEAAVRELASKSAEIQSLDAQIAELQTKLQIAMVLRENRVSEYAQLPQPQTLLSTELVDQKISAASETNAKAIAYEQALKRQEEKHRKENELVENIAKQKAEESKKVLYMQSLNFPQGINLTVDDNGGLMMDMRPIQEPYFSTGELMKICMMLVVHNQPDFRYVYLGQFDLLDDKKAGEVLAYAAEKDLQVMAERVVSNQSEVLILQDVQSIS